MGEYPGGHSPGDRAVCEREVWLGTGDHGTGHERCHEQRIDGGEGAKPPERTGHGPEEPQKEQESDSTTAAVCLKVVVVRFPDQGTRLTPESSGQVGPVARPLVLDRVAALSIARAQCDRSVKDAGEAAALAGAPVIGTILQDESLVDRHVIPRSANNRTAEDYRQLRNNLQFLSVDEPPKLIMISSALPSEGKTTVTINLALALAEAGHRVTILEADLRRPRVTRYLGMVGGVGLTNILAGTAQLDEVIQPYGDSGVLVIPSGPTPPNPGELLASSHMSGLLDKLRGANDFVLIDAPPLLPVADSSGLAVHVDGALLSVRYGSTDKNQLEQAAATLERVGARTLRVILNIVPRKASLASAHGYGYGYGYDGGKHSGD